MQIAHGATGGFVLPSIRPLFALAQDDERACLRTPTSGHMTAFGAAMFPSTSPVKKASKRMKMDSPNSASTPTRHSIEPLPPLLLDAASSEDEKLRLSRERNRLHAQRTRIRKRELLESLKERIHALENEYVLLTQAFDFHATAVYLLSLGNGNSTHDYMALVDANAGSKTNTRYSGRTESVSSDVNDNDRASAYDERDYEQYHELDEVEERVLYQSSCCSCTNLDECDHRMNENDKRSFTSATGGDQQQLLSSKEGREQLRRERNRLHARRARLRKKLVLEKSQQVCVHVVKSLLRSESHVLTGSLGFSRLY